MMVGGMKRVDWDEGEDSPSMSFVPLVDSRRDLSRVQCLLLMIRALCCAVLEA
jgi:hypothetical protein